MCKFYLYDTKGSMLLGLPTFKGLGIVKKINIAAFKIESVIVDFVKSRGNGNGGAQGSKKE